jgi:hypothetical protein
VPIGKSHAAWTEFIARKLARHPAPAELGFRDATPVEPLGWEARTPRLPSGYRLCRIPWRWREDIVGVPEVSTPEASAIVVVRDPVLAASLELALLAGGLNAFLFDPSQGLERLPLDIAMTLIVDQQILTPDPAAFVAGLRARPWNGLIVLMTGDGEALRTVFARSQRIAVLEMPFVGADLIRAIRTVWPPDTAHGPPS